MVSKQLQQTRYNLMTLSTYQTAIDRIIRILEASGLREPSKTFILLKKAARIFPFVRELTPVLSQRLMEAQRYAITPSAENRENLLKNLRAFYDSFEPVFDRIGNGESFKAWEQKGIEDGLAGGAGQLVSEMLQVVKEVSDKNRLINPKPSEAEAYTANALAQQLERLIPRVIALERILLQIPEIAPVEWKEKYGYMYQISKNYVEIGKALSNALQQAIRVVGNPASSFRDKSTSLARVQVQLGYLNNIFNKRR